MTCDGGYDGADIFKKSDTTIKQNIHGSSSKPSDRRSYGTTTSDNEIGLSNLRVSEKCLRGSIWIRSLLCSGIAHCAKESKLTVSGETLLVGSDDLGLSMISANGGRLMVNLTEATRSANSKLSSVDRVDLRLSSQDPFEGSSS